MKNLFINNTPKTPEIDFNASNGKLNIIGVSVPEDSVEFYAPVINWLKDYSKKPHRKTLLSFKLAYVNTSSLQMLYEILFILNDLYESGNNVSVKWFHLDEDEDMKEVGEDLQEALNFKFSFFAVSGV